MSVPAHAPARPAQLSAPDPAAPERGGLRRRRRSSWRSAERRSWMTSSRCWTSCAPRSAGAPWPPPGMALFLLEINVSTGATGTPGVAAPSAGVASVVAAARAVAAASMLCVTLGYICPHCSRGSPGRRPRSPARAPRDPLRELATAAPAGGRPAAPLATPRLAEQPACVVGAARRERALSPRAAHRGASRPPPAHATLRL